MSRPLVYACSGYSSAAQLANRLALELDAEGHAEMSCIAGVGGGVKPLVKVATSGRRIVALDGCPLSCVQACLAGVGVEPDVHHVLSELGVVKKRASQVGDEQAEAVKRVVLESLG